MRNLALLQNNGKFNTGNDIYYFKIGDDVTSLDMSGIWIPPIGTTLNPFKGNFDGNGKIISGLRVTTNEKLSGSKVTSSAFSDVGFFGSVEGEDASISKFTLDDIYVDHNINTTYSGIIAGEAPKDSIQYVGVHTARLGYQEEIGYKEEVTAQSNFALIGNTEAHTMTVEDPGGDTPGGDDPDGGDTGQFIPDDFMNISNYSNFASKSGTTLTFKTPIWLVPDETNKQLGLGSFSFTTGGSGTTIISKSLSSFYFLSDIDGKNLVDNVAGDRMDDDIPFYQLNSSNNGTHLINIDIDSNSGTYEQNIRNKIKSGNTVMPSLNYALNWNNSPNNGDFSSSSGKSFSVITEGNTSIGTNSYNVYTNSLKVKISSASTKIFVIASGRDSSKPNYLGVYKVSDRYGDYSDFLYGSANAISEKDLPGSDGKVGLDKDADPIQALELPIKNGNDEVRVGCEFNLENYGPGTYMLHSTSGGIYLHYISVTGVEDGDIGGGTEDPTSTVSYISTVDFVDSGVIITDTYDDYSYVLFIVALPATNSDTVIYFKRDDDDDGTNKVYYGTNGNGTVTNVNTTYQGTSFTDFTDYPQVSTDVS